MMTEIYVGTVSIIHDITGLTKIKKKRLKKIIKDFRKHRG